MQEGDKALTRSGLTAVVLAARASKHMPTNQSARIRRMASAGLVLCICDRIKAIQRMHVFGNYFVCALQMGSEWPHV